MSDHPLAPQAEQAQSVDDRASSLSVPRFEAGAAEGALDELSDEDWPYCTCDLDPTIDESDWGVCSCCGKALS